ncbi:MAG: hypothetical protein A3H44_09745 [Gammaproteobacteria bacterium RIFCSPLOWO2_02_FULL_57_10]|nr:MAG: hypothetical protein A3H44_09745 [Gammaproteobacteria bacterium RIFCSPLOWO2_02_FULL_57_10]
MIRIHKLVPAVALSLTLHSPPVSAMTVFDLANFRQNLSHYIDILRNVAVEQGIMDDQLRSMIETVSLADQQLQQLLLAARQLDDLSGYVEEGDLRAIYNSTQRIFGRLSRINPNTPDYASTVNQTIEERYPMPTVLPPYEAMVGSDLALSEMGRDYEALQRNTADLGDRITNMSAAGQLSQDRRDQIEQYRQELESLQDQENPALATSQLTTKQQNLILLQNEEMIARLDMEEQRRLEEAAELLQFQHQLEADRHERLARKSRRLSFSGG